MINEKIPDAEVVDEEKHATEAPPIPIEVVHPVGEPPADEPPVRIRVEYKGRHRLEVRMYEIDEDGVVDIVITDADAN